MTTMLWKVKTVKETTLITTNTMKAQTEVVNATEGLQMRLSVGLPAGAVRRMGLKAR